MTKKEAIEGKYCDRNICTRNDVNRIGCEDCEVTKSQKPITKNDLADDKTFYEQMVEYCNEHFLVLVEKDVWEDARKALTTKNDLGVDCISRQEVLDLIADYDLSMGQVVRGIHALPSVTPQFSSELEKNSQKLEKDFGELDCISREQAKAAIRDRFKDLPSRIEINAILNALPSVTPQEPRWIPVKDRLPKKGEYGDVLVTFIPTAGILWATVMIARYSDLMGIAKPCFHIGEVGKKSFENITPQVIAWMPLPKAYEPQESEDKE